MSEIVVRRDMTLPLKGRRIARSDGIFFPDRRERRL